MIVSMLRRYWFHQAKGLGYGVTAHTREEAERLLAAAGLPSDPIRVDEDVDVSQLDARHVLPNIGLPSNLGVWFPCLNL